VSNEAKPIADIESAFNACQHREYCRTLAAEKKELVRLLRSVSRQSVNDSGDDLFSPALMNRMTTILAKHKEPQP
jgi:hypothetical protein